VGLIVKSTNGGVWEGQQKPALQCRALGAAVLPGGFGNATSRCDGSKNLAPQTAVKKEAPGTRACCKPFFARGHALQVRQKVRQKMIGQ
jgi:hypothetical protein